MNVQHDLAATLGSGDESTKELHDKVGHHAADGALSLTMAILEGEKDEFYSSGGSGSDSIERMAKGHGPPYNTYEKPS